LVDKNSVEPASVKPATVVMFANSDWYLYNFRRSLALKIQSLGHGVLLISPDGEFGPRLRELGLRWKPLPMQRRGLRPDVEARLVWRLIQILSREQASLIHNFTIKCVVYGSLAAIAARVPNRINAVTGLGYVFTSNDLRARVLTPIVHNFMRCAVSNSRTRVIVQNRDDEAALIRMGATKSHLRLIPSSGVDCEKFVPRRGSFAALKPKRIVFCGRLLWDKGIAEFVQAARTLQGQGLEFIAAGAPDPGNPAAIPIETIREWEGQGLVHFPGHIEDIPRLLAETDVFVLPSYREGLPRSLIEAGACGLPLIATDVPGCRDVITNGHDGLLVPSRDATALAAAISQLVRNPDYALRLGLAAREKICQSFNENRIIQDTLDVYEELMPGFKMAPCPRHADKRGRPLDWR
jgi:glycosyltransferase involved in cell wall biosynthesis